MISQHHVFAESLLDWILGLQVRSITKESHDTIKIGDLQNQDRKYFGPVRIQKFTVKLMNDKGEVVNLNGTNWSFTIICEIMVNQKGN